ncbi:Protein phosphatase-like protein [Cyphellophora attinorum]|uniref:Protein phosphatase n=1 Tax=Cyphellophora attinorum TaxID=1664694 RepID=A0A0N0NLD9_9EURO|nr:Protein phosphatase-like protein [Phialophora attinorum]KPI39181.1 Protein phosphatase-like protein [Phialophora attinorum]
MRSVHHVVARQRISKAAPTAALAVSQRLEYSISLRTHAKRSSSLRAFATSTIVRRRQLIFSGATTSDTDHPSPTPSPPNNTSPPSPYYLETGYAIFAKRHSRPFPPPFLSTPSHSFSDPLTTHQSTKLRSRRPQDAEGRLIGGITNGDDAVIISGQGNNFLAVGDGVGAWAQKERGHAALWSRLIVNYWAAEVGELFQRGGDGEDEAMGGVVSGGGEGTQKGAIGVDDIDLVACLQRAFVRTRESTGATGPMGVVPPKKEDGNVGATQEGPKLEETHTGREEIMGTTTASGAVLHHDEGGRPVVVATTLGDSMIFILRPDRGQGFDAGSEDEGESQGELIYKSKEQYHWFDCPRQLGTNSPDTPNNNAIMDKIAIEVGDVIVVVSDGVTDNLFDTEIVQKVCGAVKSWEQGSVEAKEGMVWVARELMNAAREIAQDPNAESPYMEKALDEGISAFGGKLDDISVVLGVCRRREK